MILPFGLILPLLLALLLLGGRCEQQLQEWRVSRLGALLLLLAALLLTYVDLPLGSYYFNLGGVFILGCGIWLLLQLPASGKWRALLAALLIGAILTAQQNGLLWQLDQYRFPSGLTVLLLSIAAAAGAGSYRAAGCAAALGVESAGLVRTLSGQGEMGWSFFNLLAIICGAAWLILLIAGYFRPRQLTNRRE